MEKEMRVLGYQPELLSVRDAGGFLKALQNCAQPDALILCPLSGNLQQDAACIQAVAQVCQRELEPNEGAMKHLVKRQKLSQEQAQQLALLPQGARIFPCHQSALPGFEAAGEGFHIVVMPSDPEEQISLFFSYLFQILKKASASPCVVRVARVMEMDAAQVEQALAELLDAQSPCVAVYPKSRRSSCASATTAPTAAGRHSAAPPLCRR